MGNTLLRIALGKMVGSLQTMGLGKLDLVKECRILECPTWPQGISNLFKIVNKTNRYKNISFNNHVGYRIFMTFVGKEFNITCNYKILISMNLKYNFCVSIMFQFGLHIQILMAMTKNC